MGRSVGYSMDAVVILQNLTVPCQEMEIDPYGMPVEHLELSDADMTQILKEQGGDYANTFLARNIEEADTNLPSLIAIDAKTKVRHNNFVFFFTNTHQIISGISCLTGCHFV